MAINTNAPREKKAVGLPGEKKAVGLPGEKKAVGLPGEKKAVGLPVIILAVVLGLALIGFIGYRAFNPPQAHTAAMQTFDDYMSAKAKLCNRDFSKLSKADQAEINGKTMGHGADAIRSAK